MGKRFKNSSFRSGKYYNLPGLLGIPPKQGIFESNPFNFDVKASDTTSVSQLLLNLQSGFVPIGLSFHLDFSLPIGRRILPFWSTVYPVYSIYLPHSDCYLHFAGFSSCTFTIKTHFRFSDQSMSERSRDDIIDNLKSRYSGNYIGKSIHPRVWVHFPGKFCRFKLILFVWNTLKAATRIKQVQGPLKDIQHRWTF